MTDDREKEILGTACSDTKTTGVDLLNRNEKECALFTLSKAVEDVEWEVDELRDKLKDLYWAFYEYGWSGAVPQPTTAEWIRLVGNMLEQLYMFTFTADNIKRYGRVHSGIEPISKDDWNNYVNTMFSGQVLKCTCHGIELQCREFDHCGTPLKTLFTKNDDGEWENLAGTPAYVFDIHTWFVPKEEE